MLLFTQFFLPDKTGTGKVLGELFSYLALSNDIDVLSSRQLYNDKSDSVLIRQEVINGIKIKRVFSKFADKNRPIGRIYNYLAFFTLAILETIFNKLTDKKDILVSVSNPPIMPLLPAILKSDKQKFIYILHDLYPDLPIKMGITSKNSSMSKFMFAVNNFIFKKADKVVVLGRDMQKYLCENYHVPITKINIITNWSEKKCLDDVDYIGDRFKVIYSGNMGRFHNLEMLVKLAERHYFIDLEFIGEGAQKEALINMVSDLNLKNVVFTDFLDEDKYISKMSTANAFAVSLEKNLTGLAVPSKFYTYLSMGRPIICIAEPECEMAIVIKESMCGIIAKHDDIDSLCNQVEELHRKPQIQVNMGESSKNIFHRFYEKDIVMKQFEKLFGEV